MEIGEALVKIREIFGKDYLLDKNILSALADFEVFKNKPWAKFIIKHLIEDKTLEKYLVSRNASERTKIIKIFTINTGIDYSKVNFILDQFLEIYSSVSKPNAKEELKWTRKNVKALDDSTLKDVERIEVCKYISEITGETSLGAMLVINYDGELVYATWQLDSRMKASVGDFIDPKTFRVYNYIKGDITITRCCGRVVDFLQIENRKQ